MGSGLLLVELPSEHEPCWTATSPSVAACAAIVAAARRAFASPKWSRGRWECVLLPTACAATGPRLRPRRRDVGRSAGRRFVGSGLFLFELPSEPEPFSEVLLITNGLRRRFMGSGLGLATMLSDHERVSEGRAPRVPDSRPARFANRASWNSALRGSRFMGSVRTPVGASTARGLITGTVLSRAGRAWGTRGRAGSGGFRRRGRKRTSSRQGRKAKTRQHPSRRRAASAPLTPP